MSNFLKLTTIILMFTTAGFAMKYTADIEKITNNNLAGLNHHNDGVVESAIKNVIFLKINFPQYNYTPIIFKLDELTITGKTKSIRLKAMIAGDFLKNYDEYKWIEKGEYEEGDEIFNIYLNTVNKTISVKNF